jgi:hypothetical protein
MNTISEIQQRLESSLRQSIYQYEQIYELLRTTEQEIGIADPVGLEAFSLSLQKLQTQARQIDQDLVDLLRQKTLETGSIRNLLDRRELLLKEILQINGSIAAKANGVKSLIAHDIGKLRNGISAMSGYRQQQHNQGRLVNSTS